MHPSNRAPLSQLGREKKMKKKESKKDISAATSTDKTGAASREKPKKGSLSKPKISSSKEVVFDKVLDTLFSKKNVNDYDDAQEKALIKEKLEKLDQQCTTQKSSLQEEKLSIPASPCKRRKHVEPSLKPAKKAKMHNEKTLSKEEKVNDDFEANEDFEEVNEDFEVSSTAKKSLSEAPDIKNRTVFVGNVPVACLDKEGSRQLKDAFSQFGQIESMRFRSIAFDAKFPDRKSAFLAKKLNTARKSVNAYIRFDVPEAAAAAVSHMNGSLFMNHHLRVDSCGSGVDVHCNKKTSVFVGNLPFDVEEEQLWMLFGPLGDVVNVRIIRDKKSNMGKGIAFVQFKDVASVEKALALNDQKFNERPIRISRFKGSKIRKSKQ